MHIVPSLAFSVKSLAKNGLDVIKPFFMLISAEHDICYVNKYENVNIGWHFHSQHRLAFSYLLA